MYHQRYEFLRPAASITTVGCRCVSRVDELMELVLLPGVDGDNSKLL